MTWLRTVAREVFGLFVDDGIFASLILLWAAFAVFALPHVGLPTKWVGLIFFCGLAAILVSSSLRYKRPRGV